MSFLRIVPDLVRSHLGSPQPPAHDSPWPPYYLLFRLATGYTNTMVIKRSPYPPSVRARFGEALRQAREAAGVSQTDLAGLLSQSQTVISGWEQGVAVPSPPRVFELEGELKISPGRRSAGSSGTCRWRSTHGSLTLSMP